MVSLRWLLPLAGMAFLTDSARAQTEITATNATVQHLRLDETTLRKLGGDSIDTGLNKLGAFGFEIFSVTSIQETGAAGFHYLKRQPWVAATPRPAFEYKRLDSAQIEKLGGGNFDAGLGSLEKDEWELVALTTNAKGGAGYHYFKRKKK